MNNFPEIRTGVIGVGSMGQNHARIYKSISNLVGVSDPNEELGLKIAEEHGVKWYQNYEELLDKVDALSVAVPTHLHSQIATVVSSKNVHLLVEKPLSNSITNSKKIIKSATDNNVVLAVGHVERHNPVIDSATSYLVDNPQEKLLTVTAKRFSLYPQRIADVGVLFDLTIHDVDIINYFANSIPRSVYAAGGKCQNKSFEDYVNLIIKYENGIVGICQTSWLSPIRSRKIELSTERSQIGLDLLNKEARVFIKNDNKHSRENLFVSDAEPLKRELVDFLFSIQKNQNPKVTGNDGLKAVNIIEAAVESLENDKIVRIK